MKMAVKPGFEPGVQLPVRQFSKLVVSATHPLHHFQFFSLCFQKRCKDSTVFENSKLFIGNINFIVTFVHPLVQFLNDKK